jgi:DNA-binding NtrC family response regulator
MQDPAFEILFLGEDRSWSQLTQAFLEAPDSSLHIRRVDSLAALFQDLADGRCHGLLIDAHAWNFRGLHYVEKVRSEYPVFPIIALHSDSVADIDAKAAHCGASRSLPFARLSTDSLRAALTAILDESKFQSILERNPLTPVPLNDSGTVAMTFSKNQVITHALNNLLCVISANAELLADQFSADSRDARPLTEIKKAAKSAAALMRHLK